MMLSPKQAVLPELRRKSEKSNILTDATVVKPLNKTKTLVMEKYHNLHRQCICCL